MKMTEQKSKIAVFDIDDTITYESEYLRYKAPSFLKKHDLEPVICKHNGYSLDEIYGLKEQLKKRGMKAQEAARQAEKLFQSFWNENFLAYNLTPTRRGTKKFIHTLKEREYRVYFLTLRGNHAVKNSKGIKKKTLKWLVPVITKCMLRKNGIVYDNVFFMENIEQKAAFIRQLHPRLVFDDQISLLDLIQQEQASPLGVCLTSYHNAKKKLPNKTIRIRNFEEGIVRLNEMTAKGIQ